MRELEMDDFHEMLLCGRKAAAWAWEHYEELASRPHAYTLYGPHAYFLGASIPSTSLTPVRARQLRPSTRRKDHLIYHLDEEYRVIRTITVLNHTYVDSTHHHFQLDGMTYAYPFDGTEKAMATDRVKALKFEDGKPVFYGMLSRRFVFAQFYEYLDADKMITTTYRYAPEAKRNVYGYPIDPAAPIGAMNSSVEKHVREEPVAYIDFSHWFV